MYRRPLLSAPFVVLAGSARAALTGLEQAAVGEAERNLNSITTLRARFTQVSRSGGVAEGTFDLKRPGRARFAYDPPAPFILVADGSFVHFYDRSLDQYSAIPIGSTPLAPLLAERVSFSGAVEVTRVLAERGVVAITVIKRGAAGEGSLTLGFTDDPFAFRFWTVVDAKGEEVRVTLSRIELGGTPDPALFRFVDPHFGRQRQN